MIRRPRYDYDLLVLGSGAAGSTAALVAARADKKVGLIEADTFGGETPKLVAPLDAVIELCHTH